MNEVAVTLQFRKALETVGVGPRREIEKTVRAAATLADVGLAPE